MKLSNNWIKSGLSLQHVSSGLASEPGPDTKRVAIKDEERLYDSTDLLEAASTELLRMLILEAPKENYYNFTPRYVFRAFSAAQRSIIYAGRVVQAFATEAVSGTVPVDYGYVDHFNKTVSMGVKAASSAGQPVMCVIDSAVINVPDVEKYTKESESTGELQIPLNFEITDPSRIHVFYSQRLGEV